MIKKRLNKIVLILSVLSSSLMASDTESLIAIEAGYHILSTQRDTTPSYTGEDKLMSLGFKVGAQTDDYRVFVGGSYFDNLSNDFDYIFTYEIEGQYLMNLNPSTNIFVGLSAGMMNMEFTGVSETGSRTIADPYMGVSAGVNYSVSENIDFDFGARASTMDAQNFKNNVTYKFDTMISVYTSLIYKYTMN